MNLESIEPNYLFVVIGGVAYFALGAIWYTFLFQKAWLAAQGKTPVAGANPGPMMALTLLGAIVTTFVVAVLYEWGSGDGLADGIAAGLLVGVGVVAMESFKGVVYYGHSWTLYAINTGYDVSGIALAGAIYGAFA